MGIPSRLTKIGTVQRQSEFKPIIDGWKNRKPGYFFIGAYLIVIASLGIQADFLSGQEIKDVMAIIRIVETYTELRVGFATRWEMYRKVQPVIGGNAIIIRIHLEIDVGVAIFFTALTLRLERDRRKTGFYTMMIIREKLAVQTKSCTLYF